MIYIYIQNEKFVKQIRYIFEIFFHTMGVSYTYLDRHSSMLEVTNMDILVLYCNWTIKLENYEKVFKNIIRIYSSDKLFGDKYFTEESLPSNILKCDCSNYCSNLKEIISLYHKSDSLNVIERSRQNTIISLNSDIISASFLMLTRYEEVIENKITSKERYNRYAASYSLMHKYDFLDRPIVNEYIELIWYIIDSLKLNYKRKKWWGQKDFAACISHDVDNIQKHSNTLKSVKCSLDYLKKNDAGNAFLNFQDYFKSKFDYKKDPFWTFEYIVNLEKRCDFISSFYFMSGGTSKFDNKYLINDKRVIKLINYLEDGGFEVGYHGSFNSYNNIELMEKEVNLLDKYIIEKNYGIRQHFLRFTVPYTWRYQEELGLLYDSTLGFADYEGFRCGFCFPFKPYDLIENRVLNIWEIPLIVMDGSLQDLKYRGLSSNEGFEKIKKLINTVKSFGGVFTLLWHNSSLTGSEWSRWKYVYERSLEFLVESNCLGISGRELIYSFK